MDQGLCWDRNCCGKKVRSRGGDNDLAGGGRNQRCWNRGIDNQREQNTIWGDHDCDRRQSERPCMFWELGGWGRCGWWIHKAGQAECRWWTRLGGGHNLQKGTAAHGESLAPADDNWPIDAAWMVPYGRLLSWKGWGIWHYEIKASGSRYSANGWSCRRSSTDYSWRANGVTWYHPRKIGNTTSDFMTLKWSYQARPREATVKYTYSVSGT